MNRNVILGFCHQLEKIASDKNASSPIIMVDRHIDTGKLRVRIDGPGWTPGNNIDIIEYSDPGFFGKLIGRKPVPIRVERSHLPLHHPEHASKFIKIPYNEEELKARLNLHLEKNATKLKKKSRNQISEKNFALPGRRYPIHDKSHARSALSFISRYGSESEKSTVRAAVAKKYPGIGQKHGK